tara:strand:+ start:1399 stop:1650 length:252 start_codon:yes stop_codon:yes gene_type:complete
MAIISTALIMGFIAMVVGLMVGVFIFSAIEDSIDCPDAATNPEGSATCDKATNMAWAVMGILPITLFVGVFALFGGMNNLVFR